ncbi:hypothetical protein RB195_011506 [Necator americanus]|uniref:Uncharacterized protein n=1 Tax=Necator americanus TaxID=51031 RepID=A0ABR1D2V2_NECAM
MSTGKRRPNLRLLRSSLILDQGNTRTTRHGDCLRLCTYNARTVSTDGDLHVLLGAAEGIKFQVIALQETKCRSSDVRQMNDGTLVIRGEKAPSRGDRHNGENHVNYEMLLRGLRACAERATKELLERRNTLRLDTNASHIERKRKILEAAQRRTSLQKCHRDLREYNIPLAFFLSEDGTRTSSCHEMEIITVRFYSNLLRSSTPLSSPIILAGRKDSRPAKDLANRPYPLEIDREDLLTYRPICLMSVLYKEELNRRMRAAWALFAIVREATDQLTDQDLLAHLFDSTVLPALRSGDVPDTAATSAAYY